jgi:hypothetical protein
METLFVSCEVRTESLNSRIMWVPPYRRLWYGVARVWIGLQSRPDDFLLGLPVDVEDGVQYVSPKRR